jgi:hypothetical protein
VLRLLCFAVSLLAMHAATAHAQPFGVDRNRRYDQNIYLESHDAYTTPSAHYIEWITCNQDRDIIDQLDYGVRSLDLRIWLVQQKAVACNPQAIIYNFDGATGQTLAGPLGDVSDAPLEIVLGHHIWTTGYSQIIGFGVHCGAPYFFEDLTDRLSKINQWLANNPSEVLTLDIGTSVPDAHTDLVRKALDDSGLLGQMFFVGNTADGGNVNANVGILPSHGRPGGLRPSPDGWWVAMDGFPTVQELADSGRRLVYLPDGNTFGSASFYTVGVDSIYGEHSVPTGCLGEHWDNWTDPNQDPVPPVPIDDFTRPLFLMQHVHSTPEPTHDFTKCVQDISWLTDKLNDTVSRWHRLPNLLRVDHAAKDTEVSGPSATFKGPGPFVAQVNQMWGTLPAITPTWSVAPPPTGSGWNNASVTVSGMWGTGDTIREVVFSVFTGRTPTPSGEMPTLVVDRQVANAPATYPISQEGKSVVSFYAVGSLGNTSDRGYADVWIDETAPSISGSVDRPPNAHGWYKADVIGAFTYQDVIPAGLTANDISGIDPATSTPTVTLSTEGANQTITGTATDKAGNKSSFSLPGINLDKTPPSVVYSGNAGTYTVDQHVDITCSAMDGLSGVYSTTCKDISGDAFTFNVGNTANPGINAYSATAVDNADNLGQGSTVFKVVVTPASLSNLTLKFVTNAGVANSLIQKLDSTAQSEAAGDLSQKAQHIAVYLHELAQATGHFVTPTNAAILAGLAATL